MMCRHALNAFIVFHTWAVIVTGTLPNEGYALSTIDMLTMDGAQARVVSVNGGLKTVIFMHDTAEAPSELALQSLCELRHKNETKEIPCAAAVYTAALSMPIVPVLAGRVAFAPPDDDRLSNLPGFGCTHHDGQEGAIPVASPEASTLSVVRRGGCSFADKARFARSGGYVGLLVVDSGEPIAPSLGDEDTDFPVVMVSESPLLDLLKSGPASSSLHLQFFGGGLGSTDAEAVFWYGDFLRQSKEMYAATYHYAKALTLEPAFLDAAWALANAWFSLNATQEAHRALAFARSELAPDFTDVVHRDLEAAARRMSRLHGEESSTQSATSLAQRVHVVAVATKYKPQLDMLKRSVEAQGPGWTLDVIGGGVVYAGRYGAHGGIKIELLLEWLQPESKNIANEADIVLFVDAYDVAFLPNMGNELIRRFLTFDAAVVTGGDNNCYPDRAAELLLETLESLERTLRESEKAHGSRPFPKSIPAPFLNSGTFIGRASDLRLMLERIVADAKPHYNDIGKQLVDAADQRLLTRYWMSHPDHLKVDHFGELFQTLHDIPKEHFRVARPPSPSAGEAQLWSSATGVEMLTCVLHGNGNGFAAFSDFVTDVGLSESTYEDHGFLAL